MSQVNLDALIPREDLHIKEMKPNTSTVPGIAITALKKGDFFFESLRKPQFQRSTWEWTPEKVYNLVKSFTSGDLIPAIILWRGEGNNFVIDGAHRLSALMAWVNNDYGDGNLSRALFEADATSVQKAKAKEAKKLIEEDIGSYEDIVWAGQNPDKAIKKRVDIARQLSALSLQLQWVPGNASQAEDSFFKINEAASPLDATEKRLLKARDKPSAIAARAIIRSGTGHKYWSKFPNANQNEIVKVSREIHDWLFKPQLNTPVKTLDIPLAGKSYTQQTQELILNVVNFSNNIKIIDTSKIKNPGDFPEMKLEDESSDGMETIKYLNNTHKMLANITGTSSMSLGIHPAIYCYSLQGRYQITSFMALLSLVRDYEQRKQLINFTMVRKAFEEFLWKHKVLVNQATTTWGSGAKGYVNLAKLFDFIILKFRDNKSESDILSELDTNEEYNFFKSGVRELNPKHKKPFSSGSKSEVFMKQGIEMALRCNICGGFLHSNSIQIDHVLEIERNGIGNADNGQLSHPFCNSIKKNLVQNGFLKSSA